MKKDKLELFRQQTLLTALTAAEQEFLLALHADYYFSLQEFRFLAELSCDLRMWQEPSPERLWQSLEQKHKQLIAKVQRKQKILSELQKIYNNLKTKEKNYGSAEPEPLELPELPIIYKENHQKIFGRCPVYSELTLCCGLYTLDAVENCPYACSYCTIQTFYQDHFLFHKNLSTKLAELELEPNAFYHIGTGQSSDALVWGNHSNILIDLCNFAAANKNVLLELKTKSAEISFFQQNKIPQNIVCSWTLNTPTIIQHEERLTAQLEQRLEAARKVADRGIKIAFHFHPMIIYRNWQAEYQVLIEKLLSFFKPDEIAFISFGTVTMIKPAIRAIRKSGRATKILQMPFSADPHGKWSYPEHNKLELYRHIYAGFRPWHQRVFFYLCMETPLIWQKTFGYAYANNFDFQQNFLTAVQARGIIIVTTSDSLQRVP